VSTFTVDHDGRVLWCLRRRVSDIRCVVYVVAGGAEVHVLQERDLVLKEELATEAAAVLWAGVYRTRLEQRGWRDSRQDCSPSSAA
jgi:hypothetical protein